MTVERITAMVAAGESETLEFKNTTGARREAAKTLCAMLNHRGGCVLFGVTPEGRVTGQQVSEHTLEQVSAEFGRIDPPVFPEIERIQVAADRQVVMVSTGRGPGQPYQYRGTAYRRVRNTTVAMSADEYNRVLLERVHSEQRWENQPADGWSVKDLDEAEIRRTVDEGIRRGRLEDPGTRETTELLRGLGLFRDGILWRAAVVLFGDARRIECEMPQCLLRVARFRGLDRTEFLDNRQFHGNTFTLLKAAEQFLRDMLPIAGRFEEHRFERIDEPRYPTLATREALANALCHRDYSIGGGSVGVAMYDDRLEITSSGALHFGLTPEKLFTSHESLPWNPLIARTFYRRGIIEEWGRGTIKMAELMTAAGLPRPEIKETGSCVMVCFRHNRRLLSEVRREYDLTEQQQAILTLLDQAGQSLALRDIHARLEPGADLRRVREDLYNLKEKGLIVPNGHGRGARWTRS